MSKTGQRTKDYRKENEMRKKAIEAENEFLKEEVIGQGAMESTRSSRQNIQSNIERAIEGAD
jgi:hypothetical protein